MSKTLPVTLRPHAARIVEARQESDGWWWVELADGWWDDASSSHTVHERTLRKAAQRVRDADPCDCENCKPGGERR